MRKRVRKKGTDEKPRYEEHIALPGGLREAWAEIDLDETWTAAYRMVEQEGRLVIAETRVLPTIGENDRAFARTDGTRPLRTRALGEWSGSPDAVPEGGLPADVHREVVLLGALERAYRQAEEAAVVLPREVGLIAGSRSEPRGRKRRPPLLLAEIAELYGEAIQAGSRTPNKYIRSHKPGLSESTTKKLVQDARDEGFLTPAPGPGVPGGQATPAAWRVLGRTP